MLGNRASSTACLLAAAALALVAPGSEAEPPKNAIAVTATFDCLWWSEAQMDGLDPNNPPPKETRVPIKRWEYSDPVGVPHPNVVDLVVRIKNDSPKDAEDVSPVVYIQWSEGPVRGKQSAVWGQALKLPSQTPVHLAALEAKSLRFPIDIAGKMSELDAKHQWPWSLRAVVDARAPDGGTASTRLELPIIPGD